MFIRSPPMRWRMGVSGCLRSESSRHQSVRLRSLLLFIRFQAETRSTVIQAVGLKLD